METKATMFDNISYLINGGDIVGIRVDTGRCIKEYYVGDTVEVTGDCRGYICSGIKTPGKGKIVSVRKDDTDHFFVVEMENGETGIMKYHRMEVIKRTYT